MVIELRRRGRPSQSEPAPQKGTQALERGITILQYLAASGGSASVTVIAERLNLPLSTTFRLLKTLESAGLIYQDTEHSLWNVGLELFRVGASYLHNHDLVSIARLQLRRLMLLAEETVNLAIYNEGEAVLINQCECQSMVRMCAQLGSRLPLHASGAGKALLYGLEEQEILGLITRKGLQSFTPNTLTTVNQLHQDLQEALKRGYAIDQEEHALGLNCVASAIFNQNRDVVGALSISGPSTRVTPARFTELGDLVKTTAEKISNALGYQ